MPDFSRTGWTASSDSANPSYPATNVLDGNTSTEWRSTGPVPHSLIVDMQSAQQINYVRYYPGTYGSKANYIEVYVSTDGVSWGSAVVSQLMPVSGTNHYLVFPAVYIARYFKLVWTYIDTSSAYPASCAEIYAGKFVTGESYTAMFISRGSTTQVVNLVGTVTNLSPTTVTATLNHGGGLTYFSHWGISAFVTPPGYTGSVSSLLMALDYTNAAALNGYNAYFRVRGSNVFEDIEYAPGSQFGVGGGWLGLGLDATGSSYRIDTLVWNEMFYNTVGAGSTLPDAARLDVFDRYLVVEYPAVWVAPPPVVICDSPPTGVIGQSYTHAFPASSGLAPYTWAITAGSLPPGLTLNAATGIVSGTPTTAGSSSFTVQVTDNNGNTSSVNCSIPIVVGNLWLDIWVWRQLFTVDTLDQELQFPTGYERALVLQLAHDFGRQYPGHDMSRLREQLAAAIAQIEPENVSNSMALEELPLPEEL